MKEPLAVPVVGLQQGALNALRDDSVNNGGFRLPALADPGTPVGYEDLVFRNLPVPLAERNNPNLPPGSTCMNRDP